VTQALLDRAGRDLPVFFRLGHGSSVLHNHRLRIQLDELHARALGLVDHEPVGVVLNVGTVTPPKRH
jgi:hypothetical protein